MDKLNLNMIDAQNESDQKQCAGTYKPHVATTTVLIEQFVLPVSASVAAGIITGQITIASPWRLEVILAISLAAFFAAATTVKYRKHAEMELSSFGIFSVFRWASLVGALLLAGLPTVQFFRTSAPRGIIMRKRLPPGTGSEVEPGGPTVDVPIKVIQTPPEEEFVKKYVSVGTAQAQPANVWAIVFADAGGNEFPQLRSSVSEALAATGRVDSPIFRPSLISEGAYENLYRADANLLGRLSTFCEGIIVGKVESTISQDPTLEIVTSHMRVTVRVLLPKSKRIKSEFRVEDNGAGFSPQEAGEQAEARLAARLKEPLREALRE
jgi:hypothetical protein